MRRRTYLVTGGAGFIGSHLVEALLDRGERVVVLDDLSTGNLSNLGPVLHLPHLRFVHGSALDVGLVDKLVAECEIVVHLAASVGVKLILERPLHSFINNIRGTETVIEAADRHARQILLASTSEVYGKNPQVPMSERADRVLGPPDVARWFYSTSKAVDEILAHAYHRERGLRATVVRLFNTVGRRQSPAYGMVIPRLVRQAAAGEPLTVFGDGGQTRCFCHVLDVVDAVLRLLDTPAATGQVFNIGSTEEISILRLAERVLMFVDDRGSIALIPYHDEYPEGFEDMRRRVPDTTKIRVATGWQPTRTLDDILGEAMAEAVAEQVRVSAGDM